MSCQSEKIYRIFEFEAEKKKPHYCATFVLVYAVLLIAGAFDAT